MPHLTTPRLSLRHFVPDDVSALHAIESDPIAVRYQSYALRTNALRTSRTIWRIARPSAAASTSPLPCRGN
jgi:RimJ/RimL family protein N-acetyltransferase